MSQNPVKKALSSLLSKSTSGLDLVKFSVARNLTTEESKELMGSLKIKKFGDGSNEWGFSFENWNTLLGNAIREVDTFHKRKPESIGIKESEIAKNLNDNLPNFVIKTILSECIGLGKLKRSGKYIYNTDRIVKISKSDQIFWEKIENIFISHEFSPPIVSDLASNLGMEVKVLQDLLGRLCNLGLLIRLTEKRYFISSTLLELAKIIEAIINENNNVYLDLKKFRDESGMGRNLAIEVLDFFDKVGFTQLGKEGRFIKKSISEVSLFKRSFD
jgi:selenocysteine-specific elongation factor